MQIIHIFILVIAVSAFTLAFFCGYWLGVRKYSVLYYQHKDGLLFQESLSRKACSTFKWMVANCQVIHIDGGERIMFYMSDFKELSAVMGSIYEAIQNQNYDHVNA